MTTIKAEANEHQRGGVLSYGRSPQIFFHAGFFPLATCRSAVIRAAWKGRGSTAIHQPAAVRPAGLRTSGLFGKGGSGEGLRWANGDPAITLTAHLDFWALEEGSPLFDPQTVPQFELDFAKRQLQPHAGEGLVEIFQQLNISASLRLRLPFVSSSAFDLTVGPPSGV